MDQAGRRTFLLLVAVIGAVVLFAAWGRDDNETSDAGSSEPVAVTYEVVGTADGVDLTMETPTGTVQASGKAVPLRTDEGRGITYSGFTLGDFVYISAQNTGDDGTVTCRIRSSGGTVISENTSDGAYSIATCEGSAR